MSNFGFQTFDFQVCIVWPWQDSKMHLSRLGWRNWYLQKLHFTQECPSFTWHQIAGGHCITTLWFCNQIRNELLHMWSLYCHLLTKISHCNCLSSGTLYGEVKPQRLNFQLIMRNIMYVIVCKHFFLCPNLFYCRLEEKNWWIVFILDPSWTFFTGSGLYRP
jgi:hypothetical protein